MSSIYAMRPIDRGQTFDQIRSALLGPQRATLLDLSAIAAVGRVLGNNPEHLQLYSMSPREYAAAGIRLRGRTAIECCIDPHARRIAAVVQACLAARSAAPPTIVDLFLGSGNLLYHVAQATRSPAPIGFERDPVVYRTTKSNFRQLGLAAQLVLGAWEHLLTPAKVAADRPLVVLLDPPWGEAFSSAGLDLRRTAPPVRQVLDHLAAQIKHPALLFVIKTHEWVQEESVADLAAHYPIEARGSFNDLAPGGNVGYLCGWICR